MPKDLRAYLKKSIELIGQECAKHGGSGTNNFSVFSDFATKVNDLYDLYDKLPPLKEEDRQTLIAKYQEVIDATGKYADELNNGTPENSQRLGVLSGMVKTFESEITQLQSTASLEGQTFTSASAAAERDVVRELSDDVNSLAEFEKTMNAVNKGAFIGSPQFDEVMKSFKSLRELTTAAVENPSKKAYALELAYDDLQKKLNAYLTKKDTEEKSLARKGKQPSETAKRRTDFARDLQKFVSARRVDSEFFSESLWKGSLYDKAYSFMTSAYQPKPVFYEDQAFSKCYTSRESFNTIQPIDISNLSVGGKPVSDNDFAALAVCTMTAPGYGEQARAEVAGDRELSSEARSALNATMYTADAADTNANALAPRSQSFRDTHIQFGIIPARNDVFKALTEYQNGNLAPLSEILSSGMISFENWVSDDVTVGKSKLACMTKAFDTLRNIMESDPKLKEAAYSRFQEKTQEAKEKLPQLAQELQSAKDALAGTDSKSVKESAEVTAACNKYANAQLQYSYYEKLSRMKPESSRKVIKGYAEAEKLRRRASGARTTLENADRTRKALPAQHKQACVSDILKLGVLNASSKDHYQAAQTQILKIAVTPEFMKVQTNRAASALTNPFIQVYGSMNCTPSPLTKQLSRKDGAAILDQEFANSISKQAMSDLVNAKNADILQMANNSGKLIDHVKKCRRELAQNARNAASANNARSNSPAVNSKPPARGR